jgi:hypothetical protein
VTTTAPHAMASITTIPNGSLHIEGKHTTSDAR